MSLLAGSGGPSASTFKNLKTGDFVRRSMLGEVQDEHISRDPNVKGSLSIANTGEPNSVGSQFLMNLADNTCFNWFSPGSSSFTVFGQIIEGYEICVAISTVRCKHERPIFPVKMNSIALTQ